MQQEHIASFTVRDLKPDLGSSVYFRYFYLLQYICAASLFMKKMRTRRDAGAYFSIQALLCSGRVKWHAALAMISGGR